MKPIKTKVNLDFNIRDIEIREENGKKKIRGYAAVFDTPSSSPIWGPDIREVIGRSAFTKTLQEAKDIKALCNHDKKMVLGSTRANTLKLEIDEKGLYFEIDPADELRSYERDLLISMERGDISGCSFGFFIVKFHEEHRGDSLVVVIDELKLHEISIVSFPAYDETSAGYRDEDFDLTTSFIRELKKNAGSIATILSDQQRDEILELLKREENEEEPGDHSPDQDQPEVATEEERDSLSRRLRLFKLSSIEI